MKPVEVVEIYVPAGGTIGWIRTRGRWGGGSTFVVESGVLSGIAEDVASDPETQPVIDPSYATRSCEYSRSWPPSEQPRMWLVRTGSAGGKTAWVRRV